MSAAVHDDIAVLAARKEDGQLIRDLLHEAGYQVGTFRNVSELEQSAVSARAMVVCHRRSSNSPAPGIPRTRRHQRVVVLSDCYSEQDVINTLEAGAHHFFDIAEPKKIIEARLVAALRQHSKPEQRVMEVDPFKFDLEKRQVWLNDELVNLSPKEYEFANYLFSNRDRVVVNSELMTSVWSLPPTMDARRIDTAACRVRKKMQLDERTGWSLKRLRRVGYELRRC